MTLIPLSEEEVRRLVELACLKMRHDPDPDIRKTVLDCDIIGRMLVFLRLPPKL